MKPLTSDQIIFLNDLNPDSFRKGVTVSPYKNRGREEIRIAIWTVFRLEKEEEEEDDRYITITKGGISLKEEEFDVLCKNIDVIRDKIQIGKKGLVKVVRELHSQADEAASIEELEVLKRKIQECEKQMGGGSGCMKKKKPKVK